MKVFVTILCLLLGLAIIWTMDDFPAWGDADAPANAHVSSYYLKNSLKQTKVPNVVTSVLADYRAFDTLFETVVIFTAGIAIFSLLRRRREDNPQYEMDDISKGQYIIIRTASRFMIPIIQLFSFYVVAHGHYSPGGGFQGGTMLAASMILMSLAFGMPRALKRMSENKALIYGAVGAGIFAGFGAVSMIMGGNFLNYSFLAPLMPATGEEMARSHSMLGVEIGVTFTVMSILFLIYANIASRGNMKEGM